MCKLVPFQNMQKKRVVNAPILPVPFIKDQPGPLHKWPGSTRPLPTPSLIKIFTFYSFECFVIFVKLV